MLEPKNFENIFFKKSEKWPFLGSDFHLVFGPCKILSEPIVTKLSEMNDFDLADMHVDEHIDPLTWLSKSGRPAHKRGKREMKIEHPEMLHINFGPIWKLRNLFSLFQILQKW